MTPAKATIKGANEEQQRYGSYGQAQNIAYKDIGAMDRLRMLHIKSMFFVITARSYMMPPRCLT